MSYSDSDIMEQMQNQKDIPPQHSLMNRGEGKALLYMQLKAFQFLRGCVMGYKSMVKIAIKTIPPQPSLINKGGGNPLYYSYIGTSPLIAIKTIPPQPSLINKGGSNPLYYSYIGTFPLLVRGNTRGIISSYFLGLSHSLLKWGIEGDFLTFCNSHVTLSTQELEELDTITTDDVTNAAKVILFNDEVHSFDEVIEQLIKAIKCSVRRAEKLTWEVHNKGKACVYDGDLPECLRVSSVLEEIALHTHVEY